MLAAADLDFALVRPSRNTLEAAVAALDDVCFLGAEVCDKALPDAAFEALPVLFDVKLEDAFDATFLLVTFLFIMLITIKWYLIRK